MRQIDDRAAVFIYLVKHVVAEQLDDISISRFGPPQIASKLGPFVYKAKLAQEPYETAVLKLTHELAFQPVNGTGKKGDSKHVFRKYGWHNTLQSLVDL